MIPNDPHNQRLKWRLAIVVQRYGEEVNGGAELAARWLAEKLTALAEVHVLTTCALDFTTWANHFPAGISQLNGVTIHRFPVDKTRDWRKSAKSANKLLYREHTLADEEKWIREQGPYATPLLHYIETNRDSYNFFYFFTYLYATTYFGLPLVADKAILAPTAHDEPYLYLPAFIHLLQQPQLLIHLTQPERNLVRRTTGLGCPPQLTVGLGLTVPDDISASRARAKFGLEGDFLLYAGRIAAGKNVPELLDHFQQYHQTTGHPLKLALIGRPNLPLPDHPDVMPLGFVSEQDKFDLIQAATVIVMPSKYESLSIICLEAWRMERPVLVNGESEVLKYQCRQSNGGLYYTSYDEFEAALTFLLDHPNSQAQMGQAGANFVRHNYHWRVILAQYQALFNTLTT